ncbi:EI24 domain-containing protein [Crocosphaera sp. Alani8]|uniref:EI24 domain-containing protein n=1 Tax=Crocosphaera sp. Alani8 TaxID=3038952 RepID=UPI00313DACCA
MLQILTGFGFLSGISYPFRLLRLFKSNPALLSYIIVPVLVNIVVGIFLYIGLFLFGWEITDLLTNSIINRIDSLLVDFPDWLNGVDYFVILLEWVIRIVLGLFLLIITGFLLVQFGVILAAPWYGNLSEKIEKIRTDKIEIIEVGIIRDIWRAILFELKKIVLILGFGILFFFLSFVPVFGAIVSTVGGLTITGTIICLDFFDSALERRRINFRKKVALVWKTFPASAGFATICLLMIGIPFINLITIPFCVGSGTLFVCDRILFKHL